jgi:hypothetical protein
VKQPNNQPTYHEAFVALKQTLKMDRGGEFRIRAIGPNHCGVEENLTVRYQMVCLCSPKLDSRGFLFDQVNVDNYFQNIKRTRRSCEKLTKSCLGDLLKMIKAENPKCEILKMELTLSPAPFKASITYTWDEGK